MHDKNTMQGTTWLDAWLRIICVKWLHLGLTLHKKEVSGCMIKSPCKEASVWLHVEHACMGTSRT